MDEEKKYLLSNEEDEVDIREDYKFLVRSIGIEKRRVKRDNRVIKIIRKEAYKIYDVQAYRKEAFERLFAMISYMLENSNYLTKCLVEVRRYLIKMRKNYTEEDLILFSDILTDIFDTINYKGSMIQNECKIWEFGISGVHYLPANYDPGECLERTESIEGKMAFARNKYRSKKLLLTYDDSVV